MGKAEAAMAMWWQQHLARRKHGPGGEEVAAARRAVWVAVMWQ